MSGDGAYNPYATGGHAAAPGYPAHGGYPPAAAPAAPAHGGYPAAAPYGSGYPPAHGGGYGGGHGGGYPAAAAPYGHDGYGHAAPAHHAAYPPAAAAPAHGGHTQPIRTDGGTSWMVEGETIYVEGAPTSDTVPDGKYGSTQHGTRLDLDNREWQDVIFAMAFAATCLGLFIGMIAEVSGSQSNSKGSNGMGVLIAFVAAIVGIAVGFLWLNALKNNAECIIKAMLITYLAMLCVFTIVAFVIAPIFGVFMLIITAIFALYLWCQWPRVAIAAAFVGVSSEVVKEFPATVTVTIIMLVVCVAYLLIWAATITAYANKNSANGFVVLILLMCGYWGLGTFANVSHYTTCIVAFSWYFGSEKSNPTMTGFKLAATKSFGSIALGSLIVAVIQTLKAVARQARQRGSIMGCICEIFLGCLESWAQFFNHWAYSYCALYGMKFVKGGQEMWNLFKRKGIDMIVTTDFSGFALLAGALVGGLVAGVIGFVMGYNVCQNCSKSRRSGNGVLYALLSLLIGYYTCWLVMFSVRSGVTALFTAWAEDPNAMFENHPAQAKKFADAWNKAQKGIRGRCG